MNFNTTPLDDPVLDAEQAAAKQDKINAIRDSLGTYNDQLVRLFGAKLALGAGSTPTATPTSTATIPNAPSPGGGFFGGIMKTPPILGLKF